MDRHMGHVEYLHDSEAASHALSSAVSYVTEAPAMMAMIPVPQPMAVMHAHIAPARGPVIVGGRHLQTYELDPHTRSIVPLDSELARQVLEAAPSVGECFKTKKDLKLKISEITAMQQRRLRVTKASATKYHARCSVPENVAPGQANCDFQFNAMLRKEEGAELVGLGGELENVETWIVTKILPLHTCLPPSTEGRRWKHQMTSTQLLPIALAHVMEDPTVSLKKLRTLVIDATRMEISGDASSRLRTLCFAHMWGSDEANMRMMRGFFEEYQRVDSDNFYALDTTTGPVENAKDSTVVTKEVYVRSFVCPGPSRRLSKSLLPVVCIDKCFCVGRYEGMLIMMIGVDASHEPIILAYGNVMTEDQELSDENWAWFLEQCKLALPFLNSVEERCVITCRDKEMDESTLGLIPIIEKILPNASPAACAASKLDTLKQRKYSISANTLYREMLHSPNEAYFLESQSKLESTDMKAHQFVSSLPPQYWANYAFPTSRWGIWSAKLYPGLEGDIMKDYPYRMMPVMRMFSDLYDRSLASIAKQADYFRTTAAFMAPPAEKIFMENMHKAQKMHAVVIRDMFCKVSDREDATAPEYDVDLNNPNSCLCGLWKIHQIPCVHAFAAATAAGVDPKSLVNEHHLTTFIRAGYEESFPHRPVAATGYAMDELDLPVSRRKGGRPTQKRRISSSGYSVARKKRPQMCSYCNLMGHNKTKCPSAPMAEAILVANGYIDDVPPPAAPEASESLLG